MLKPSRLSLPLLALLSLSLVACGGSDSGGDGGDNGGNNGANNGGGGGNADHPLTGGYFGSVNAGQRDSGTLGFGIEADGKIEGSYRTIGNVNKEFNFTFNGTIAEDGTYQVSYTKPNAGIAGNATGQITGGSSGILGVSITVQGENGPLTYTGTVTSTGG